MKKNKWTCSITKGRIQLSKMKMVSVQTKLFLLVILLGMQSCLKQQCIPIKNDTYKGYGIFSFQNEFQDGWTELTFIPVCCSLSDLLHFNHLSPQRGLSFYCSSNDSLLKKLRKNATMILVDKNINIQMYLTPVYIDFKGKEKNEASSNRLYNEGIYLTLNMKDTTIAYYDVTYSEFRRIIDINEIKYYNFYK